MELLGSVGYAPPEQFGISQTLPASDIYAMGIVFNELLTGHSPEDRYPTTAALLYALERLL